MLGTMSSLILAGISLHEGVRAQQLWKVRHETYQLAQQRAIALGRQLLVVGDPDSGAVTRFVKQAYGCGDLCVDLTGCPACPRAEQIDITKGIPGIPDNSAVVYVSCVLEYTDDPEAALADLRRIAGDGENLFVVAVDPNTLTSYFYPGAKFQFFNGRWQPIDKTARVAVGVSLAITTATAVAAFLKRK